MSLDWNITKVKKWKEVQEGHQGAITEAITWATMSVGISKITTKNAGEFYKRLHLVELLWGSYFLEGGKELYITKEDVERRVGLYTNASDFSRAEFHKRQLKHYYEE